MRNHAEQKASLFGIEGKNLLRILRLLSPGTSPERREQGVVSLIHISTWFETFSEKNCNFYVLIFLLV